jgi:hypothetical protein
MSTESNEPVESEKAEQAPEETVEETVEEPAAEATTDDSDKVIVTEIDDDDDDDDEASSKSWVKFVVVGVLAVALIGAGVWAFTGMGSGWAVGDCASIKLTDGKPEATSESCGSDDGAYKVAKILASDQEVCPEEGLYETAPDDSRQLCLMPNFEEGNCYVPNDEGLFKKGSCTDEAVVKVVKKIDGKPEDPQCPEGSDGMPFTEPEVTYCLGTGDTP